MYPNTPEDQARRELYFKHNSDASLLPEEKAVLSQFEIDPEIERKLSGSLADFFKQLPLCQTDTALHLKKECEIPHYVLWSAMLHRRAAAARAIQSVPAPSDFDVLKTQAIVSALRPKGPADVDIESVFSRIVAEEKPAPVATAPAPVATAPAPVATAPAPVATANTKTEDPKILKLFTLIPINLPDNNKASITSVSGSEHESENESDSNSASTASSSSASTAEAAIPKPAAAKQSNNASSVNSFESGYTAGENERVLIKKNR